MFRSISVSTEVRFGTHRSLFRYFRKSVSVSRDIEDNRLILLYKGLKGKTSVPTDDHIPKLGVVKLSTLWHFRLPLIIQMFIKVAFPQTIREWNALPDSLFSSAEDCVAKFTSLVRAKD